MNITITPYRLGQNKHQQFTNKKQQNTNSQFPHRKMGYDNILAYQDFNINFTGRTPENFYAQDFNRNNMPVSMREYLDYDYETRQHIPPEQMMREVFKYIEIADNFSDVKNIYPNEDLFKNLHQNNVKGKTSILAEIKMAKDIEDAPLLKDGSDDFGMYLLKKIYLEGKTLKEINKDFYEKDMNEKYKGIITKSLSKDDPAAYGIRFPKQSFWNSFIATRDEYRKFFVTLPKNTTNPAVHLPRENNHSVPVQTPTSKPQPHHRKFKIKDFEKKQITDSLKNTNLTDVEVEKKIRKRFAKDDPQASFIIKYLSPIMTVAADRAHLSEDLKYFIEDEKQNGKNGEETEMLQRYWNRNPMMKTVYSHAITDTIDMFEDIYGDGGFIPINSDLEEVTIDTKNQKVVDSVNPEYKELLDYTQTIYPLREEKYDLHKKEQVKWENYFNDKYGNIEETGDALDLSSDSIAQNEEIDEEKFSVDEVNDKFKDRIKKDAIILPSPLLRDYLNFMTDEADLAFKLKVASLPKDCSTEDIQKIGRTDGSPDYIDDLNGRFLDVYEKEVAAATFAINDLGKKYNCKSCKNLSFVSDSTAATQEGVEARDFILAHKQELNSLYSKYLTPMTQKELNLVTLALMNGIDKYKDDENVNCRTNAVLLMLQEMSNLHPFARKNIKSFIADVIPEYTRTIIDKNLTPKERYDKFTLIMDGLIEECLFNQQNIPFLINKETVEKYSSLMDSLDLEKIRQIELATPKATLRYYYAPSEKIKAGNFRGTIKLPSLDGYKKN